MKLPKDINILVACEESQAITKEFRKRGFTAFSCDIEPCSGGHPEWHIQFDCTMPMAGWSFYTQDGFKHHGRKFDLVIAHPPCTHLCASGARWWNNPATPDKPLLQDQAINFFMMFVNNSKYFKHMAIENPIGIMSKKYRKPDQIVQPFWFGDPARKSTCWWLFNLPNLIPDNMVDEGESFDCGNGKRQPKWYRDAWNLPPKERAKARSKTFPGMARAIAEQWGNYLLQETEA